MNPNQARERLLHVLAKGRIFIGGPPMPLTLEELAGLQQCVLFLYNAAKELEESKAEMKDAGSGKGALDSEAI